MENRYYVMYEDGSLSHSGSLESLVRFIAYYRMKHPGKVVSIVDEDGYIVPSSEIMPVYLSSLKG